jgi:hypothetical protein
VSVLKKYRRDDVFGISRDLPLNYVARVAADMRLIDNLTRDKHLVIYGSSKQGKTSLRKHCLNDDDYIVIQCSNTWKVEDINTNILKRAGFEVNQSSKLTTSGKNKVSASLGASLSAGFSGIFKTSVKGDMETAEETAKKEEKTFQPLDLDATDVNDVIEALDTISFTKFIVLEDFHYLPRETQIDFAIALKAFHEKSKLVFIVIGVWLEENRLIVYNGDLSGRVVAINADRWSPDELMKVIDLGAELLNISFDNNFKQQLIQTAKESVFIVQEVCNQVCVLEGVNETLESHTIIASKADVKELVRGVVNQQSGRYNSFITQFAGGFQKTELEMHKWLLYPILTGSAQSLEDGFKWTPLKEILKNNHPAGNTLNPGNLTQALQSTASLQVTKNIKPIILDWDETNRRLTVVDRGFPIWLEYQERSALLEEIGLPVSKGEQTLPFSQQKQQ